MKTAIRPIRRDVYAVVLIASPDEWLELETLLPDLRAGIALGSEWKSRAFGNKRVVFVHTGSDAVSAAAISQHAADQWQPVYFFVTGAPDEIVRHAFEWVAERNRIPFRDEETLTCLIETLNPPAAVAAPASEPDAVVPLPDRGSE